MTAYIWRTVVRIDPDRRDTDPGFDGSYTPVVLDCGHVSKGNQAMAHKVGTQQRCFRCEHPDSPQTRAALEDAAAQRAADDWNRTGDPR